MLRSRRLQRSILSAEWSLPVPEGLTATTTMSAVSPSEGTEVTTLTVAPAAFIDSSMGSAKRLSLKTAIRAPLNRHRF